MAKLSSKTSALLLMVVFAMISSLPREAESSKLTISWPKWFWCFPECVVGKTCFMKVHEFCRHELPDVSVLNCILVALEWCDIMFFDLNKMVIPPYPPSANSLNDNESVFSL
ncbi:hypothetical protein MA16_Dca003753 [Dendrobium catenatum]|uniref:Prolamin-like domain-containing protein n=1 Tax=Dendrobium catenatum TaxID=906689 RepID=A0A2I0WFV3_9ASPA|nr:hypothetical protein MA16_Dca003753 [Dendrobium catenatum]